jgi:hypothetical protein
MSRPTWLLLEDIEDAPNLPRDLEREQADNMKHLIGIDFWDLLVKLEERNGKIQGRR